MSLRLRGRTCTTVLMVMTVPLVMGCDQRSTPDLGPPPPVTSTLNGAALTWERLPDPPFAARRDAIAVGLNQQLVIVGGNDGRPFCDDDSSCGSAPPSFGDGAAYDPVRKRWDRLADSPVPLISEYPFVVARGALFVLTDTELLSYDADANTWERHPAPHERHRYARLEPRRAGVAVIGGTRDSPPDEVFDPSTGRWAVGPKASGPARAGTRAETGVPAGWNVRAPGDDLSASDGWLWDSRSGEIVTMPGPAGPRRLAGSAAWVGSSLFVMSGLVADFSGSADNVYDSVWVLRARETGHS